jgi:hypothetical protein
VVQRTELVHLQGGELDQSGDLPVFQEPAILQVKQQYPALIIGKCFFLLGRSYDGSLVKVCGILPQCRQAGGFEQGLKLK